MKITFLGATERVTGSCYLLGSKEVNLLIDCGLFQGDKEANLQNWDEFTFDASKIDFVIITHSHIDHIGRLPLLYKRGFRGKIYSTKPTAAFARIFLEDTCHILKDTAGELKKDMLYSLKDVEGVMGLFETYDYYQTVKPNSAISLKFHDAGHILGSAIIEISIEDKTIVFSGDLGNPPVPILRDTDFIARADYVVMESTYGDRIHQTFQNRQLDLERVIEETKAKNGVLLIPSFAMERTQEIIYELDQLIKNKRIQEIPIYIDSPLAIKATEIYKTFPEYFDEEASELVKNGHDFFRFPEIKFVGSKEESIALDKDATCKIIIAGSGMSTGGRILNHEKRFLSEPSTTLLIIGFQVKGTLGRQLKNKSEVVTISGEQVPLKAKVVCLESYSAHADQAKLKYWLGKIAKPIKKVFLVHGEKESQDALLHLIEAEQGLNVYIPKYQETIDL